MSDYFVIAQTTSGVVVQVTPSVYQVVPQPSIYNVYVNTTTGPAGPAGPSGASGSFEVVTADSVIPIGQLFTIVDAVGATTQTLPPISDVLIGSLTTPYNIKNFSGQPITIAASGSDQIEGAPTMTLNYNDSSVDLLPTSLGWLVK